MISKNKSDSDSENTQITIDFIVTPTGEDRAFKKNTASSVFVEQKSEDIAL